MSGKTRRIDGSRGNDQLEIRATFEQAAMGIAIVGPGGNWLKVKHVLIVGHKLLSASTRWKYKVKRCVF